MRQRSKNRFAAEEKAFTFRELFVVIAVLAVLFLLAVPVWAKLSAQAGMAQCSDNLRRFVAAMQLLATESNGQFPQATSGSWAWDLPASVRPQLVQYGVTRQQFYCPVNPLPPDGLWTFMPPDSRPIGYAMTLPGMTNLASTNLNFSLIPPPSSIGFVHLPPPLPSQRVLMSDTTFCASVVNPTQTNASSYIWNNITTANQIGLSTSHLSSRTNLPAGGNLGMLDGHVEWRPFSNMLPRTAINGGGAPVFWW